MFYLKRYAEVTCIEVIILDARADTPDTRTVVLDDFNINIEALLIVHVVNKGTSTLLAYSGITSPTTSVLS